MTNEMLYVAKIVKSTSADGPGLRNSLYVSGCPLRCDGCHNEAWWNKESGELKTVKEVYDELTQDDFNISILGGEPMMQYEGVLALCKAIKANTGKDIWMWTGYPLEHIKLYYPEILWHINVIVDGPFIKAMAKPNLKWRGSTNQRVIALI